MSAAALRRRAAALLGWAMLPLPLTGIVLPPFWIPAGAAAAWTGWAADRPPRPAPRWLLNLLGAVFATAVAAGGGWRVGPLRPLGHLLLLLAAVRAVQVADRRSFLRSLQTTGVVWVVAVAASHHVALLGYLAASAAVAWWLGIRLHLEGLGAPPHGLPRPRHVAAATAASLLLAVPVFVVMPRLDAPLAAGFGSGGLVAGFGPTVDTSGVGGVRRSRRLAAVVTGTPTLPPGTGWMYLRGAATLWLRTGTWRPPSRGRRPLRPERGLYWPGGVRPLEGTARVEVELLRPRRFLPLPDGTVAVRSPVPLWQDRFGALLLGARPRGALRVTAWVAPEPLPGAAPTRADRLVPRPDARIAALARDLAGDAPTAAAAADRITGWLRRTCRYTLEPGTAGGGADPVTRFLFETRAGHCELFATALAAMLRELGHPARVVTGYAGGTLDPARTTLLVRRENAHAWVEVWDAASGRWRRVDPSPPARVAGFGGVRSAGRLRWILDRAELLWDRHLLGFGLAEQIELLEAAAGAAAALARHGPAVTLAAAALLAAALLGRAASCRRARPRTVLAPALERLARRLGEGGASPPPGATLRRLARSVTAARPELEPLIEEAVRLAEMELYGHRPLRPGERRRARELATALRRPRLV